MNRTTRPTPPRRSSGPAAVASLALAGLATLGAAGCQTLSRKTAADQRAAQTPPTTASTSSGSAAPKTDFHREVTPVQQFNVHLELARVLESQGNTEAAVAEYQKATDVCEKYASAGGGDRPGVEKYALAQRRMAAAFDRMGRFAQAQIRYEKALQLAPRDAKVWNDVGYSYYLQNRWADAERALKSADSIEPNNPRVLTNLGLTLAAQNKEDEALDVLARANGPAVAHANLGFILAAMGKTAEARKHYESALAIQPELAPAREAIARIDKGQQPSSTSPPSLVTDSRPAAATPPLPSPTTPAPPVAATTGSRPAANPAAPTARAVATAPPAPARFGVTARATADPSLARSSATGSTVELPLVLPAATPSRDAAR